MRYQRIEQLKTNDVIALPVIGYNGQLLVKPGSKLSNHTIQRLKDMGYKGICIHDKLFDDVEYIPLLDDDFKCEVYKAVHEINVQQCLYLSTTITNRIMESDKIIKLSLEDLGNYESSIVSHSVSVAVYAGMLAAIIGYEKEKINQVVQASLLHDIGKSKIDINIINKAEKLTQEEYEMVKNHSQFGYDMLKDLSSVDSVVRVSVLQHHENYNGTGYPLKLQGDNIYNIAQIIHICDVYDAMISKRTYKQRINPIEVLQFINEQSNIMFNPELVHIFSTSITPFPEGSEVLLSNGEYGIVKKIFSNYPLYPIVKTFNGKEYDTRKTDVTIKDYY